MRRRAENGADERSLPVCALATTRRTARLLTQLYDSHLSEYGVEAAQFALLMMLDKAPDKGQAAVCRALGMDKTTLSRNLKVLRSRGWVVSEVGEDARQRNLSLTAEGRAVLMRARPAWRRAQESLRAEMSEREWNAMWATMEAVSKASAIAAERVRSQE
jgi:DNA-binding MarR family transcriptional regulator